MQFDTYLAGTTLKLVGFPIEDNYITEQNFTGSNDRYDGSDWSGFVVATPPKQDGHHLPLHPIPHLQPSSYPNYAIAANGRGWFKTRSGFGGLYSLNIGCGVPPSGLLPGYPRACNVTIGFGLYGLFCQDRPCTTFGGVFTYAPHNDTDEALQPAPVAYLSDETRLVGGVSSLNISFVAQSSEGPVALYIDDLYAAY